MAEKMPERFGLSIVFSANSAWSTAEGDVTTDERPDNALFDYPSIRVEEVSSADFVDSPAANQRGLFSKIDKPNYHKMTKAELIELTESLEEEKASLTEQATQFSVEKIAAEAELEGALKSFEEKEEELEALKKEIEELKAKLAEHEEEMAKKEEAISEHDEEMAKKDEELDKHYKDEEELKAKTEELSSKVVQLEKLIEGTELVEASTSDEVYEPSKANRAKIISEFAKEKGITEFAATLRLGKERPELFKL